MPDRQSGKYWDAAWNPITGCTAEYGCWERCWARAISTHFPALTGGDFSPRFHPDRLPKMPDGKGKVVAVCWLGDMFAEGVEQQWQENVWWEMGRYTEHIFLVLTKRVEAMCEFARARVPQPHIWLGASAYKQRWLNWNLRDLAGLSGWNRWLSLEPMLYPMSLSEAMDDWWESGNCPVWFVVGGETGPGARRCDPDWIRRIRDECAAHGVPLWVKQINRKCRLAEMPEDLRVREVPAEVGRPISHGEAMRIARETLETAERERIEVARAEAKRGIHYKDETGD